jgi:hypothetical protein
MTSDRYNHSDTKQANCQIKYRLVHLVLCRIARASITGPKTPINRPDDESGSCSGSSRRGRFNASFPLMTRSPTFPPQTTTRPRTSGSAAPRPSPPGPTSPASPWLHNHAYRRASLSPSRFPSICRSQVDGAKRSPRYPPRLWMCTSPKIQPPPQGFELVRSGLPKIKASRLSH